MKRAQKRAIFCVIEQQWQWEHLLLRHNVTDQIAATNTALTT